MVEQEPTGDTWRTLDHLAGEVRRAADKVDNDRQASKEERDAYRLKTKWWKRAAVVGIACGIVALWAGWRANEAIDQMRAQRSASRIATCVDDNSDADKLNALNDRTQDLLRNAAAPNGTRTDAQQSRTDSFLADELAEYEAIKVPMRDCSPAALERFYRKK